MKYSHLYLALFLALIILVQGSCKKKKEPCDDCSVRISSLEVTKVEVDTLVDYELFTEAVIGVYIDGELKGQVNFSPDQEPRTGGVPPIGGLNGCVYNCDAPCYQWCPVSENPEIEIAYSWWRFADPPEAVSFSDRMTTTTDIVAHPFIKYTDLVFQGEHIKLTVDITFEESSDAGPYSN